MANQELQERIKKLPQWAQRYINKLKKDADRTQYIREAIEQGETNVWWDEGFEKNKYYLPPLARFYFKTANGTIDLTLRKDRILVHGSLQLVILPEASNTVAIEANERQQV